MRLEAKALPGLPAQFCLIRLAGQSLSVEGVCLIKKGTFVRIEKISF